MQMSTQPRGVRDVVCMHSPRCVWGVMGLSVTPAATWVEQASSQTWAAQSGMNLVALTNGHLLVLESDQDTVWTSKDAGATWSVVASSAGWGLRKHAAVVALADNTVVLMGGQDLAALFNDVWVTTDYGRSWARTRATSPWSPRSTHQATVTPDGTTIILAGGWAATGAVGDVWRSVDHGVTWDAMTTAATWAARGRHGLVALPTETTPSLVVLCGGHGDTWQRDVWRSRDLGKTWSRLGNPPWPPLEAAQAVAYGTAIVVAGGADKTGGSTVPVDDVWVSPDAGDSWTRVTTSPGWAARDSHTMAVTSGGDIIVAGGHPASTDVWRSPGTAPLEWHTAACNELKLGLCAAPVSTVGVEVALPAAAGVVLPPNSATGDNANAGVVYAPPVPAITRAAGQTGVAATPEFRFGVSFTAAVTGLTSRAFEVDVNRGPAASTVLIGAGTSWTLRVSADPSYVVGDRCPSAYYPSPASSPAPARWCVRVLPSVDTWQASNAACAPFSLATVTSPEHQAFVSSARDGQYADHWCAPVPGLHCPPLPNHAADFVRSRITGSASTTLRRTGRFRGRTVMR